MHHALPILIVPFLLTLLSCSQQTIIRKVSLTSHLTHESLDEPDLLSGELIEYIPNKKDPFHTFNPVMVQLPISNDQAFLKGYVFGYACQANQQIQCIGGMTEFSSSSTYHSGYINGCRDGMGHEKWDKLFGEVLNQYL